MSILTILLGITSVVYVVTNYMSQTTLKLRDNLNNDLRSSCHKLHSLNENDFALAIKPIVLWVSISLMVLAGMILKLWGEDDQDTKQLSLVWFGSICIGMFALISNEQFEKILKELSKTLFSVAKCVIYATVAIIVLTILAKTWIGQPPSQQEVNEVFTQFLGILPLYLALMIAGFLLVFVGVPFLTRRGFVYAVRKLCRLILHKRTKDPVGTLLFTISTLFLLVDFVSYLIDRLG